MGAAREKDQADFDLERFIDMFDEAMTSPDPRVIDALRSLMMMVVLTKPESRASGVHDRNAGPLRRLYEDMNHLTRRMSRTEDELRSLRQENTKHHSTTASSFKYNYPYEKYSLDTDMIDMLKNQAITRIKGSE